MAQLQRYHFSLGNSSDGPVGFCAEVIATSLEAAVAILKEKMLDESEVMTESDEDGNVGYLCVYFNSDAITAEDCDLITDMDE